MPTKAQADNLEVTLRIPEYVKLAFCGIKNQFDSLVVSNTKMRENTTDLLVKILSTLPLENCLPNEQVEQLQKFLPTISPDVLKNAFLILDYLVTLHDLPGLFARKYLVTQLVNLLIGGDSHKNRWLLDIINLRFTDRTQFLKSVADTYASQHVKYLSRLVTMPKSALAFTGIPIHKQKVVPLKSKL